MRKKISIIILLLISISLSAQTEEKNPTVFGYVKTLHQSNFDTGQGEFAIVHARIGVKGSLNKNLNYRIFTDLNRLLNTNVTGSDSDGDGQLNDVKLNFRSVLLDAFFNLKLTDNLNFSIGQYKIPFSTSNLRSPVDMVFINRPLTTSVTPALRDIGLTFYYSNNSIIPIEVSAGVFNGSGENVKENDKTMNYSTRLVIKPSDYFSLSGNFYGGKINTTDVSIFDFGAHVKLNNVLIDAEFVTRKNEIPNGGEFSSNGFFIYSGYIFETDFWIVNSITPLIRFDSYDPFTIIDNDELKRITVGVNFGLTDKNVTGIRLNYEARDTSNRVINTADFLYVSFQVVF